MAEYIEQNKLTCRDCYHHEVCDGFGFVLDPLHGGVICDSFVKAADVVEIVRCKDCVMNENCLPESVFRTVGIDNPFCCVGKRKDGEG